MDLNRSIASWMLTIRTIARSCGRKHSVIAARISATGSKQRSCDVNWMEESLPFGFHRGCSDCSRVVLIFSESPRVEIQLCCYWRSNPPLVAARNIFNRFTWQRKVFGRCEKEPSLIGMVLFFI